MACGRPPAASECFQAAICSSFSSADGHRWNKLDLMHYNSINLLTGETLELSLKNQKPFYFSKWVFHGGCLVRVRNGLTGFVESSRIIRNCRSVCCSFRCMYTCWLRYCSLSALDNHLLQVEDELLTRDLLLLRQARCQSLGACLTRHSLSTCRTRARAIPSPLRR